MAFGMPARHSCRANEPIVDREKGLVAADCDHVSPRIGTRQAHGGACRVRAIFANLNHLSAVDPGLPVALRIELQSSPAV